jgi:hypothetical protein
MRRSILEQATPGATHARLAASLLLWVLLAGCNGPGADRTSADNSEKPPGKADYLSLTFDVLGAFAVPDPTGDRPAASPVPPEIRDLNGREVAILGYMVPVDYEAEGTNRFVLLKCTLACCYGKIPRVNEWIDVTMDGGRRVPYYKDEAVWVFGRLEVNEEVEGGNLVGLYWLHADKMTRPKTG